MCSHDNNKFHGPEPDLSFVTNLTQSCQGTRRFSVKTKLSHSGNKIATYQYTRTIHVQTTLHPNIIRWLQSYLRDRQAACIFQGKRSACFTGASPRGASSAPFSLITLNATFQCRMESRSPQVTRMTSLSSRRTWIRL